MNMNPNNYSDPDIDQDDWDSFNNLIKSANNFSLNDQNQTIFTQNPVPIDPISDFFGSNPLQTPFADQGFMRKIHPLSRTEVPVEMNTLSVDSPFLEKNALYSSSLGQKSAAFPPKKKEAESSVLKIKVNTKQSINLPREDVQAMFERFGAILDVVIHPNGTIYIIFSDIRSAIQAEKIMSKNDQLEDGIKLSVALCNQVESQFAWEKYKANKIRLAELEKLKKQYAPITPINSNSSAQAQSLKYTCKYEIQIDNDKDFQIARRIIGSQGSNMKKVIQECQAKYGSSFLSKQNDFLKLRLRGRGSGFKEGTHKKESNEPLHLCVSSKHNDVYQMACQFVDELLQSIYSEYRLYCQRVGKVLTRDVKLKYVESIPTKKKKTKNTEPKNSQPKQPLQLSKTSVSFMPQEKEEEETDISVSTPHTDRKLIEELLAAFVRATQEMNFAGADAIRHQLKLLGIPLSSDTTGRGKAAYNV